MSGRAALTLLLVVPTVASAVADRAKGYAEYRRGDVLIVEGQRVRATAATRVEGDGIAGLDSIPLGWEVEVDGERDAAGVIGARQIEAKPNGRAMFEEDVLEATDEIEAIWLREGRMFEPGESGETTTIGRIVETGPRVDRVRTIMRRHAPPYVDLGFHEMVEGEPCTS